MSINNVSSEIIWIICQTVRKDVHSGLFEERKYEERKIALKVLQALRLCPKESVRLPAESYLGLPCYEICPFLARFQVSYDDANAGNSSSASCGFEEFNELHPKVPQHRSFVDLASFPHLTSIETRRWRLVKAESFPIQCQLL